MIAGTSLLLLSLLSGPLLPPRLQIDVVFGGRRVPPDAEAVALSEVTSIWDRYGVDVRRVKPGDEGRDQAVKLPVVVLDHHGASESPDVLGSILLGADPHTAVIRLYADSIEEIVSKSSVPSWALADGSPLRDLVIGRVLGRALAHEIGHYLLRLPWHAPAGLMRARQRAADLVSPDDRMFTLSGDELIRLESVLSTAPQPTHR